MVHFSIHQLSASLSPKNVSLRLRKRQVSNASSTTSQIVSSPSNLSVASSTLYRRQSIESITSTSTAASSAFLETCNDLGLTSPYHVPSKALRSPKKSSSRSQKKAPSAASSLLQLDMCGFHFEAAAAEEESFFVPELAVLEPRPDAHRFCGFEETLEQRSMMPFRL
ncbi:hypothetical protein TWF694_007933 [Orbilia ellipsospora]|uniref:Uncharacterized protein n=1 Tax=Orbilia ellipsospora TaxID=2528407 RepID=A0AAV9XJ71_9PEZI